MKVLGVCLLIGVLSLTLLLVSFRTSLAGEPGVATNGEPETAVSAVGAPDLSIADATIPLQQIAGSVFVPMYSTTVINYGGAGCQYVASGSLYTNFPLVLPPGSKLSHIGLFYKDTSTNDARLYLRRNYGGQSSTDIVTIQTDGAPGPAYRAAYFDDILLDYTVLNYSLVWAPEVAGSTLQLCGVRVGYTAPGMFGVALPMVIR